MDNVILIGMSASGKSTLGRKLARRLGMDFLDPDLVIEEGEGKGLALLLEELGEEGFLRLEESYLTSISTKNTVIAPGGSCVLSSRAMGHLKSLGLVLYLRAPFKFIQGRVKNAHSRGIVGLEGHSLREVYERREPLYERYADIVVDTRGRKRREVLEEMEARVRARRGDRRRGQ